MSISRRGCNAALGLLLHNTPAAFHGRPALAEQLTEELTDVLRSGQVVSANIARRLT